MRLNPFKCAFAMETGKFLGFMITHRGVEANPEKCEAIIRMTFLGCIKDVQRTTPQASIKETPFLLTYRVDAVIPVEVGEPSPRLCLGRVEEVVEKDLVDETREMAHLSETVLKQRIALRYNAKVLKKSFEHNDLVLRCNDVGFPTPGEAKLAPNWEGPYRVKEVVGSGAYKLERLDEKEVPRMWNVGNLKRFYS
ncbi:uncharacterized protein [Arachis hypogaea]|uniref:uncharacterized protein n=1 Tax=Arachis hypogaea TaxID=3818 RepID=UPI000DEC7E35|nr:uncharacterized protein LOC112708882 [Arachis hypogaea]